MTELVIKQDELIQLNNLLGSLPYASAAPVVNLINAVAARRMQEEEQAKAKKEIINAFAKQEGPIAKANEDEHTDGGNAGGIINGN